MAPADQNINQTIDRAASSAQNELTKVKAELEELRIKSKPKLREANSILTSSQAIGFYQGVLVGATIVLGYAKYNGGLKL